MRGRSALSRGKRPLKSRKRSPFAHKNAEHPQNSQITQITKKQERLYSLRQSRHGSTSVSAEILVVIVSGSL